MRFLSIVPALLCAAALVLSFLCMFAGSKQGFMEEFSIVTLNASRIGQNVLNTTSSHSSNPLVSFVHNITDSIENDINNELNSLAQELGLHDFYSVHILDFCEGYYTPTDLPNATFSKRQIHQNVTSCSNRTALFNFNPRQTLQKELNETGHSNININDLDWPSAIDKGLHALKIASEAVFVLYCIAIGLIFVALCTALLALFFTGRLSAFINILVDWLAFLAIGLASAIATAVAAKSSSLINKHGNDVGIAANRGNKFLILTWVATGVMFIASLVWCFDCIVGRKSRRGNNNYANDSKY